VTKVYTQQSDMIEAASSRQILLSPNGMPPQSSVRELWHLVLKRKKALIYGILGGLVAAGLFCLLYPAKYDGIADVQYNPQSQSGFNLGDMIGGGLLDNDVQMQTQAQIMGSDDILWAVILKFDLGHNKDVAHSDVLHAGKKTADATPKERQQLLKRFNDALLITALPKTQIMEVRFRCHDAKLAADVANAVARQYEDRNYKSQYESTLGASTWLNDQLVELKNKVDIAEQKLAEYQKKTGIIGTPGADGPHDVYVTRLDELNKVFAGAQSERIVREARYRVAKDANPDRIAELVPDSTLPVLRTQLADLNNTYAQLKSTFGDKFPRVVEARNQITQVQAAIDAQLIIIRERFEKEYIAAKSSEDMLSAEIEKQKKSMFDLTDAAAQYDLLKREVESTSDVYADLQKKLNEAGISAGLQATTNVTVTQWAHEPGIPKIPNIPLTFGLGLFVGLLSGIAGIALAENVDTTIRTPEHIEALGDIVALGVIPRLEGLNGKRGSLPALPGTELWVVEKPQSAFAEAFRSLRSTILLTTAGSPPRIVSVTSSLPGEGKTTVSINIAATLAQRGRRVLLVEADLRRSTMMRRLGLDLARVGEGLSECLTGAIEAEDAIQTVPSLPTLHVLPAGKRAPNPGELLDSDKMRNLIRTWRSQYDNVILDCPPMVGLHDPIAVATESDGTIIVARSARTGKQSLRRVRDMLLHLHVHILGVVLNDFDPKSTDYQHYYGYSQGDYKQYYDDNGDAE